MTQQVAQGKTIRANKTWRNTGGAGTRDIYAAYGTGLTLETFAAEFGKVALDQYCAAGAQAITTVECQVPATAAPGLRNALVGVGKYTDAAMTFDDYEIVPNAIEVMPAIIPPPPTFGTFYLYIEQSPVGVDWWAAAWGNEDWGATINKEGYQRLSARATFEDVGLAGGYLRAIIVVGSTGYQFPPLEPAYGYGFGPFSVEHMKSYILNLTTGSLRQKS